MTEFKPQILINMKFFLLCSVTYAFFAKKMLPQSHELGVLKWARMYAVRTVMLLESKHKLSAVHANSILYAQLVLPRLDDFDKQPT